MASFVSPEPSPAPQAMSEQLTFPQESIQKPSERRFWILALILGVCVAAVVFSLVIYQLIQPNKLPPPVLGHVGESPRGVIVDRHGALLAADRYSYQVTATPDNLATDDARMLVANTLQELASISASETFALLRSSADDKWVELAKSISLEAGERIKARIAELGKEEEQQENESDEEFKARAEANAKALFALEQVTLTANPRRFYPEGQLASHVMGIVARTDTNPVLSGYYGLEGYYDAFLRQRSDNGLVTKPDMNLSEMDAEVRRYLPSLAGKDLVLTIDRTIQWIIEDELAKGLTRYRAQQGTIIVMDPKTGAIWGLANNPTFDPNQSAERNVDALADAAISAQYEPGSIFKVITAAAALDSGAVTTSTVLTDTGSIAVGNRVILNSSRTGWGPVDMTGALARSLNVITAQWALLLGPERFYSYVQRFGFGSVTEIDLENEVYGTLKLPGNPEWSPSDLGTNSFGQGLAVTPIQMIAAVAAIANEGKLMRPYIVDAQVMGDNVLYTRPTVVGRPVSAETAAELSALLVDVVDLGNSAAAVSGYSIAGKSGTAQIATAEGYTEDETIVSFVGFAPADDPQFVVLVKMDRPDPSISPWADYTAAPVFSLVARRLFDYFNIPPDKIRLAEAQQIGTSVTLPTPTPAQP